MTVLGTCTLGQLPGQFTQTLQSIVANNESLQDLRPAAMDKTIDAEMKLVICGISSQTPRLPFAFVLEELSTVSAQFYLQAT